MEKLQKIKFLMDDIVRIIQKDSEPAPPKSGFVDDGKPFTDSTPMPFGKYKGTPLGKLPDEYVIWMKDQRAMANKRLNEWLHPERKKERRWT